MTFKVGQTSAQECGGTAKQWVKWGNCEAMGGVWGNCEAIGEFQI